MMRFLTSDIPFLIEETYESRQLPNGLECQIVWEYTLNEALYRLSFEDEGSPILMERVIRKQNYIWGDYYLTAGAVTEWRYWDDESVSYPQAMLGYRGYWMGEISHQGQVVLQPEAAILLCFTPDLASIPPFIETLSQADLSELLEEARYLMEDDDTLAFSHPSPIGSPLDAPPKIEDALRRMRSQSKIVITRGRTALLERLMAETGIVADNGGWRILPEEIARRQGLGLR